MRFCHAKRRRRSFRLCSKRYKRAGNRSRRETLFFDVKLGRRMKTAKSTKRKGKVCPTFVGKGAAVTFLPSSLLLSSRRLLSCVFPRNSRLKSTRPSCLPTTPPARLSALPLPSSSLLFAFSSLKLFPAFVFPPFPPPPQLVATASFPAKWTWGKKAKVLFPSLPFRRG